MNQYWRVVLFSTMINEWMSVESGLW